MENLDDTTPTPITGLDLFMHFVTVFEAEHTPDDPTTPVVIEIALADSGTFYADPTTVDHPHTEGINSLVTVDGIYAADGRERPGSLRFAADDADTLLSVRHVAFADVVS